MRRANFSFLSAAILASGLMLSGTPGMLAQMHGGMGQSGPPQGMQQNNTQQNNMQQNGQMTQQNNAEANFVATMRRNSKVESDLSKMALKNSSNDQVKSFATQVISDNRKSDMSLTSASSSNGQMGNMSFPAPVPSQTKQAEKQMKKLTGTDFDKMYLSQMLGYVKNDQKSLSDASSSLSGPDMGSLVMQMRNTADERTKQIAQVAQSENFKIE